MHFLKRTAIIALLIEAGYLVLFNAALNLSLTQDLINQIKPDKFFVSWQSAWTPYPFRVFARGVSANGQARSQQWSLETPEASATISLFPLLGKTVALKHINATDVQYFQRPRPKEGKDFTAIRSFFPPINGRQLELSPPILDAPKQGKKPWKISIQDMRARGNHSLWLYQVQARLSGQIRTDLSVVTRGGPLALKNGDADIDIHAIVINGNREVVHEGRVKGGFELQPLVIKENKGLKALAFLKLDLDLDTQTESLAFLNVYLHAFEGMKLDGAGKVQGHIAFDRGALLESSKLDIEARALRLGLLDYRIEGNGLVEVKTEDSRDGTPDPEVHFAIAFNALDAYYAGQSAPLLSGDGLVLNGRSSNTIVSVNDKLPKARSLTLSISSLRVPDLGAMQRFIPSKWALSLYGGEGNLSGKVSIDQAQFSSDIRLSSEQADIGFNRFRFGSNLDLRTNVNSPSLASGRIDVSGTHIKLGNARVASEASQSEPWHAQISIDQGHIQLNPDKAHADVSTSKNIIETLRSQDIGSLLAAADEDLKISGNISDLRWINVLLNNSYGLKISGKGGIQSNIVIESGWLAPGTSFSVIPQQLSVEILDYIALGEGNIDLNVSKGGEFPDLALELGIHNAQFQRKLDTQAFVEDIDILLQATARSVNLEDKDGDMDLRLQIPSARIRDMSVYNQYLPEQSPLEILSGEADLNVDISLQQEDASGYVRLDTQKLRAIVDDQQISAKLGADIVLAGGVPKDMRFDISGSTIKLNEVKVIGEHTSFRDDDWASDILFEQADTVWKKPVQLDAKAKIKMTDSIPLVSMMENQKGKETWLSKALTIDDVAGDLTLQVANNQIVIPYAFASSDNIDVGAKAIISKQTRDGVIYVRYKKLKGLLKINDGKRNLDIIGVQEKFENYSTSDVIRDKGL